MRTAATLCASSTVGVAAAGLSFGEAPSSTTSSDHTTLGYRHEPSSLPTSSAPSTQFTVENTKHSNNTEYPEEEDSFVSKSPAPLRSAIVNSLDSGKKPPVTPSDTFGHLDPSPSISRSTSRLRRWSSLSPSWSSPSSLRRTGSRSLSRSSKASAPLLSSSIHQTPRSDARPNKLVKRSLSVHLGEGNVLKRPATSHQRSATLSQAQGWGHGGGAATSPPQLASSQAVDVRPRYKPYFSSTKLKQQAEAPHSPSPTPIDRSLVHHIVPDRTAYPVLVSAAAIAVPKANRALFTKSIEPAAYSNSKEDRASFDKPVPRNPRRSFSISNLFFQTPTGKRLVSRRVASAPTAKFRETSPLRTVLTPMPSDKGDASRSSAPLRGSPRARVTRRTSFPGRTEQKLDSSPIVQGQPSKANRYDPNLETDATLSPTFPSSTQSPSYQSQRSITPPGLSSSHVDSDADVKVFSSGDEDDGDAQSDTAYDSLRTARTQSSSDAAAPSLETLFHKSPPSRHTETPARGFARATQSPKLDAVAELESVISTPKHSTTNGGTNSQAGNRRPSDQAIPSSPLSVPESLSLGKLQWDADGDNLDWSDIESLGDPAEVRKVSFAANIPGKSTSASPLFTTPRRGPSMEPELDPRSTLFDWAEQRPDRNSEEGAPPRPKTVHGENDADARAGRSTGRRVTSGLHVRSQSVPNVPDVKQVSVTHKFGTWGVGSKGVAEDWDDDFDFADNDTNESHEAHGNTSKSSETGMLVPRSIQEQQTHVLANIELLREWGLMIEELKVLRSRAVALDIIGSPEPELFDEVDAMIELADQEPDESSLDAFRALKLSPGHENDVNDTSFASSAGPSTARPSVDDDVFGFTPQSSPMPSRSVENSPRIAPNRPRKDSEAMAQSIILAVSRKSNHPDRIPSTRDTPLRSKGKAASAKVPFDTATLRHIVGYVNGLTRRVKKVFRDAEGLASSPVQQTNFDPPISKAFAHPESDPIENQIGTGENETVNPSPQHPSDPKKSPRRRSTKPKRPSSDK